MLNEKSPAAELYKHCASRVRRQAQKLVHDRHEAEDVVQETFLAFMRAYASLRGEAAHSTVLHRIATNLAMNRLRQRSRVAVRAEHPGDDDEEDTERQQEAATAHEGGRGQVEALEELAVLTRGETPQALRVAYHYFVERRTFEEIGQELGIDRKLASKLLWQLVERARQRRSCVDSRERAMGL